MIEFVDLVIVIIFAMAFQYNERTRDALYFYIPHLVLGSLFLILSLFLRKRYRVCLFKKTEDGDLVWRFDESIIQCLSPDKKEITDYMIGACLGFVGLVAVLMFVPFVELLGVEMAEIGDDVVVSVVMIMLIGLAEELMWRGVVPLFFAIAIHPIVEKLVSGSEDTKMKLSFAYGHLCGALLFGWRHLPAYYLQFGSWAFVACAVATLMGLVLSYITVKYGIYAAIWAHRMYNLFVFFS